MTAVAMRPQARPRVSGWRAEPFCRQGRTHTITSPNTNKTMNYMEKTQADLQALFESVGIEPVVQDVIIPDIKKMLLESYRNGQKAGAPKAQRRELKSAPAKN